MVRKAPAQSWDLHPRRPAGGEPQVPCDSPQVPGDACCPGIDGFPVAEVAFGSPNRLHHHPFSERQTAVVEGSEEDALLPGPDGLLELCHLLRLLLGVLNLGAQRADAEQPHRVLG